MRTRVLLCGDRPPNCRWRPLQIRPLDRPVCLPLALSFAFVSIYPPVFSPYPCLRILSFSLLYRAFEPRIATLLVGIRSFYYRFVTNKNLHCVYFVLRGRRWYYLIFLLRINRKNLNVYRIIMITKRKKKLIHNLNINCVILLLVIYCRYMTQWYIFEFNETNKKYFYKKDVQRYKGSFKQVNLRYLLLRSDH